MDEMRALILEMHNESNEYRQKNIHKALNKSFTAKNFAPDGSGKMSFKNFRRCHVMLPHYFTSSIFSTSSCSYLVGNRFGKKVYFKRLREDVRKEFTKARKDIEKKKMDQFEGALSHAVMNDTVAALLTGKDPPADASDDCIKEASRRVKKIKAKAERLKMDVNDATKQKGKKKTNISRQQESDSEVDESSGDDDS